MARPKSPHTTTDVALSLKKTNISKARKKAFQMGISFSELVDRLLVAELEGDIAKNFNRTQEAGK